MEPTLDLVFVVVILGGLAAWIAWGWLSWIRTRPTNLRFGPVCSLAGFAFASLSASLEIGTGLYAQFAHGFRFMDPTLLRIYGFGSVLALVGLISGLCGVGSKNPLRWKTPILSTVLLLLWLAHAMGE